MKRKAAEPLENSKVSSCSKVVRTNKKSQHVNTFKDQRLPFSTPKQSFEILPIERFSNSFPFYREPCEIGAFSVDENRKFHNHRNNLKEYKSPRSGTLDYDLGVGYENFKARDENIPERLDHLLRWVNLHREKFKVSVGSEDAETESLNTDFITWRGHLVKILCTPYETREPWQMNACKHNGTIFICEVETEARKRQRSSESQRQKEMCYWGYKFEDYMTKPLCVSNDSSQTTQPLNNSEQFCSVIRSRLNKHSLVIGAEVDCCALINGKIKAPASYIELKTSRIMDHRNQRRNFSRFKLKKFWAQSYLAGVPKIICGMRDDNGIVRRTETFETLDIPKIASTNNAEWNSAVCMNFCDSFLQWMKDIVVEDDANVVYSFRFDEPFKVITVEKLRDCSTAVFMPDWFLAQREQMTAPKRE